MRHRLQQKVFDGGENKSSSIQESRIPSTFTFGKNPHLTKKNMLHSKSTYFYRWGSRLNYVVPSVCGLALLVGGIVAINPLINTTGIARANDDLWPSTGDNTSDTAPSISISFPIDNLPDGFNNDTKQTTTIEAGKISYRSNIFSISTKNVNKYHIALQAAPGYTNELVGVASGSKITGVGRDQDTANFPDNTWGYAITDDISTDETMLIYNTVPTSTGATPQDHTPSDINSEEKRFKLTFAAKINSNKPSDHYQTQILLSAAIGAGELSEIFGGIHFMQDMSKTICSLAKEHDSTILYDNRDNNAYWVAKLKDGNCWMTQNLAYDGGGTAATLDSNGTSVSGWPDGTAGASNMNKAVYLNPGVFMYLPTGNKKTPIDLNTDLTWTSTTNQNFINATSYTGTDGRTPCTKASGSFFGTPISDSTVCNIYYYKTDLDPERHYMIGNYYTYNAATNGTGANTSGTENAPGSVCPDGWILPAGTTNNTNGSFYYMLNKYGLTSKMTSGSYSITDEPLYFTKGGMLWGSFSYTQTIGQYWTSTSLGTSRETAYNMRFNEANSGTVELGGNSSNNWRAMGLSIRCLFMAS